MDGNIFTINWIVVTGPESSGKTTLATAIAKKYNGVIVQEYAREYLEKLNGRYNKSDLLEIARGQINLEIITQASNPALIISDTDLLTIKIWSEYKYESCDQSIIEHWSDFVANKFYILTNPDFDWEYDPLRENPIDQQVLYEMYKTNLEKVNAHYITVQGSHKERMTQVDQAMSVLTK